MVNMENRIPAANKFESKMVKRENTIKIGRKKKSKLILCSYEHPKWTMKGSQYSQVKLMYPTARFLKIPLSTRCLSKWWYYEVLSDI